MRTILFGTGAMASLFAVRLSKVATVTLLGNWSEAITAIREGGILLEDFDKSQRVQVNADCLGTAQEPADLVLVLVKSWQTGDVAAHLPAYLNEDGIAISLQNGIGNVELLGPKAYPGSTAEGATLLGPGHVRAGGSGATHLLAPEWVLDLFRRAGFETYGCTPEEAQSVIWGKLCVSCGINALTALLRVRNGELLRTPSAADLMVRAARECAEIARAKGIKLPFRDTAAHVTEVAERTANNQSSMLQDMLRGAPTECDAINGAVVGEGRVLGIPAPVNDTLWQLVQAAVHQNRITSYETRITN
jgi:2-dehydropantoate 2-reductase